MKQDHEKKRVAQELKDAQTQLDKHAETSVRLKPW